MTPWTAFIGQYLPIEGRTPNKDGWISVNCPLHRDQKQTAGINVDNGMYLCHNLSCQHEYLQRLGRVERPTLRFTEFLVVTQGWDLLDAQSVVEAYRVENLHTLFAHDDTVNRNGSAKPDASTLNYFSANVADFVKQAHNRLAENFEDIDVAVDYAYSRGLTQETLYEAGVGYVPGHTLLPDNTASGISGCLLFPYWFKNKLVGVRIRQGDSRKRMLINSHYVPYNINDVFQTVSRTIVIGEGESDALRIKQALRDMGYGGIPVVGTPGVNFERAWERFLKRFTRIVCLPQADAPSQDKFVSNLRQTFNQRLDVVQIPWEEDALGGKDVCDYLLMQPHHTQALTELLSLTPHDVEPRPYIKNYDYFAQRKDRDIDWLIPRVIERGSKCLIIGEPKVGKTFIILALITAVIHGTPFMNNPNWAPTHTGLTCMLIEEEGSERALGKRILSTIPPTALLGVVHGENVKLDNDVSFQRLRQEVAKFKPDLIIFDPYASLHNQDENEVQGTKIVLDAINTLYRANPQSTIVVVHHTGVGNGTRARGSGSLWGAMDSQMLVTKETNGISVSIKGREIEDTDSLNFEFDPDTKLFSPISATSIKVVSHRKVDPQLTSDMLDTLREAKRPLTHQELTVAHPGVDYLAIRTALLALVDANRVARTGSGGRKGYLYTLLGTE